jgi:hypothetical protein
VLFYLQEHSTKWFYWNGNYYPLYRYFAKIIRLTLKQRHLEVTHRNSFSVSLNSILA